MSTFENFVFYRGVDSKYPTDRPYISGTRKDRKPKHSSSQLHHVADAWFEKKFGIRFRSQAVCLTPNLTIAASYAATPDHVVRVLPLSEYKVCWSPIITDLYFAAQKLASSHSNDIETLLEQANYQLGNLAEAYTTMNEVMLFCESYISIPMSLLKQSSTPASLIIK